MMITVNIPDEIAAQIQARGLTPEGYVEELIAERAEAAPQRAGTKTKLADLEDFFEEMAALSEKVPILPDAALTRASFYQDRD